MPSSLERDAIALAKCLDREFREVILPKVCTPRPIAAWDLHDSVICSSRSPGIADLLVATLGLVMFSLVGLLVLLLLIRHIPSDSRSIVL